MAAVPRDSIVFVVWFEVHIILYKRIDKVYKFVLYVVKNHSCRLAFLFQPLIVCVIDTFLRDGAFGRLRENSPQEGTGVILCVCLSVYTCARSFSEVCHPIIGGHLPRIGDCFEVVAVGDDSHGIDQRNAFNGGDMLVVPAQALVFIDNAQDLLLAFL